MKALSVWKGVKFGQIAVASFVLKAIDRDLGRRYLVKELSKLPGLSAKMGQLLALKFGKMEWQEFAPEPVALSWIKSRIQSETPALADAIDLIDSEGKLASLGQVHRATLKSGEEVAIKVRYPQVDSEVDEQLDLIFLGLDKISTNIARYINIDEYERFLTSHFREELDYVHEGEVQERFRQVWRDDPKIIVPKVYPEYSSMSILTQSFEPSVTLSDLWTLPYEVRRNCAQELTRFFLNGIFKSGLVHTDLHPRNWGFRPETQQLVLYDFGATLRLESEVVRAFQSFMKAGNQSVEELIHAYTRIGFDETRLRQITEVLPKLTDLLFQPILSDELFDPSEWHVGKKAEELLGEKKWEFRGAGAPWFFALIRSLNGWLYALRELRAKVNVREAWPKKRLA